jgi:hypothetical protein
MFSKNRRRDFRNFWAVLGLIIVSQFLFSNTSMGAGAPLVYTKVLDVSCSHLDNFTSTYQKITDLGTFTLNSSDSTVETTFNGRIYIDAFEASSSGAVFELRVDDTATTHGRARANIRKAEAGGGGVPASIMGIFTGLSTGAHTISMWVKGAYGGGTNAGVNTGCWASDHLVIKEYRSFGLTYLPSISN